MSKDVTPSGRVRNYAQETKQHATPESTADRVSRNKARRQLEAEGLVKKGDGKDVDHIDGNPQDRRRGNLRVMDRRRNEEKQ